MFTQSIESSYMYMHLVEVARSYPVSVLPRTEASIMFHQNFDYNSQPLTRGGIPAGSRRRPIGLGLGFRFPVVLSSFPATQPHLFHHRDRNATQDALKLACGCENDSQPIAHVFGATEYGIGIAAWQVFVRKTTTNTWRPEMTEVFGGHARWRVLWKTINVGHWASAAFAAVRYNFSACDR